MALKLVSFFLRKSKGLRSKSSLEAIFSGFRKHIIGIQENFESAYGPQKLIYADWTATGRAYQPIEDCIQKKIMPFLGNTHTETTITGTMMSKGYAEAKEIIKDHVHANGDDVLIFCGSGMTSAVNKLQRILGLRIPERIMDYVKHDHGVDATLDKPVDQRPGQRLHDILPLDEMLRPIVFLTHMEHHSNQISWLETIATVEIIPPDEQGNVDLEYFKNLLQQYQHRVNKIAAITACSNVTGIQTPYHEIARIIHDHGGFCFVDLACSAPYIEINMHPREKGTHLDAIYFSAHKFLGGAGTPGVLVFNKKMYHNQVPDQPGGGTVVYSNPWKVHEYCATIEHREDGGTPPFLQGIKAAMCVRLKLEMGVQNMLRREQELLRIVFARFSLIKNASVLEGHITERLGVVSFMIEAVHYQLVVKILNDRFGIQTRGGCCCAGTYGHILFEVDQPRSMEILHSIRAGNLSSKPGWVRLSVHPTMTNAEVEYIMDSIQATAVHIHQWSVEYTYDPVSNEFTHRGFIGKEEAQIEDWFNMSLLQ